MQYRVIFRYLDMAGLVRVQLDKGCDPFIHGIGAGHDMDGYVLVKLTEKIFGCVPQGKDLAGT